MIQRSKKNNRVRTGRPTHIHSTLHAVLRRAFQSKWRSLILDPARLPTRTIQANRVKNILLTALLIFSTSAVHATEWNGTIVQFGLEGSEQLIKTFNEKGYRAEYGNECCSGDKEFSAIWIGREVSYTHVKYIVNQALKVYPDINYYSFFEKKNDEYPTEWDHTVYIGGSKWAAVNKYKTLNQNEAMEKFSEIQSQEDLKKLIDSLKL